MILEAEKKLKEQAEKARASGSISSAKLRANW